MRIAMRNALALTVGLVTLGGCSSHVVVRPVTGQPLKEAGAYYALPRTEITVELTVEGKINRPGTYAAWAEPLLGVENVLLEPKRAFTVKPGAKFSSRGVPDPEQIYQVQAAGRWWEDRTIDLGLDENGVVSKLAQKTTDPRVELAVSVVKTALGLAAIPNFSAISSAEPKAFESLVASPSPKILGDCDELAETLRPLLLDLDARTARAVLGRIERSHKRVCELFQATDGRKNLIGAISALARILELRGLRRDFLEAAANGGSPDSTVTAIGSLDTKIDALLGANFTGTIKEITWTARVPVLPTDGEETYKAEILRLDPVAGLCAPGAELGAPPEIVAANCDCNNTTSIVTRVKPILGTGVEKIAKSQPTLSREAEHGFVYRIPRPAIVTVESTDSKSASQRLGTETILVAQAGLVVPLPSSVGGRSTKYDIALYPETGALKAFILNSDAAAAVATVDSLGNAVVALEKAKAAEQDQLALLTREKDILKAMKEIRDLREALGQAGEAEAEQP